MFHEPRKTEKAVELRNKKQPRRFQIVKLEERIAPAPGWILHGGPGTGWGSAHRPR